MGCFRKCTYLSIAKPNYLEHFRIAPRRRRRPRGLQQGDSLHKEALLGGRPRLRRVRDQHDPQQGALPLHRHAVLAGVGLPPLVRPLELWRHKVQDVRVVVIQSTFYPPEEVQENTRSLFYKGHLIRATLETSLIW